MQRILGISIFLFTSCLHSFLYSQTNSINSIYRIESDTISRYSLQQKITSARFLFESDSVIDVNLLEEILTVSIRNNYWDESADAYLLLSEMNRATGQCENAVKNAKRSHDIYLSFNNSTGYFEAVKVLSECLIQLENYDLAEYYYTTAIHTCTKPQITEELSLRINLGRLYLKTDIAKARDCFLQIQKDALANSQFNFAAEAEIELGNLDQNSGNIDGAREYFAMAKTHALQSENSTLIFNSNCNLSNSYVTANDGANATFVWTDATSYFTAIGDTQLLINSSMALADQNVAVGNYSNAINLLNFTYSLSGATSNLTTQVSSAEKLYSIYSITNGGTKAVEAYQNYITLKDSLAKIKTNKANLFFQNQNALNGVQSEVDVMERQRDLDQQTINLLEREKSVNQSEIQSQRMLLYFLGFLLVIFVFAGFYVYRTNKAKKRATQLLYLKSLRSQMNPHFIFNSLNSVNSFISQNNEREANKYLSRFAKLMRQILDQSESEFISLTKEIEVLQLYIQLEHDRFRDSFQYSFEIDQSIPLDSYQIPPMLVQPFVENAVWHGLRYKESDGKLEIKFIDHNYFIEINIKDNGIGRTESKKQKTINQKQHNSSAMTIVESRMLTINSLFKTKIRFEIIDLTHPSGTEVKIFLYPNSNK